MFLLKTLDFQQAPEIETPRYLQVQHRSESLQGFQIVQSKGSEDFMANVSGERLILRKFIFAHRFAGASSGPRRLMSVSIALNSFWRRSAEIIGALRVPPDTPGNTQGKS